MRSLKGSHRIVVQDVEYRWHADGGEGYISIEIYPTNNNFASITGAFLYHEGGGERQNSGQNPTTQIVITNKIIRRVIEYAICDCGYNPNAKTKQLHLKFLDDKIKWDDAVRAVPKWLAL